jgi:hypothetical protein
VARVWTRHGARTAGVAALAAAAAILLPFAPFWRGPVVLRSIVEHGSQVMFSPAALLGTLLSPAPAEAILIAVLAVVVCAGLRRFARRGVADPVPLWRTLVALIAATPAIGPHLIVWIAPLLAARGGWGFYARALSVAALSYYIARALAFQTDAGLAFAAIVVVVPLLATGVWSALTRVARNTSA